MEGLIRAMSSDKEVKPKRASSIHGIEAVKRVALEASAFGCIVSGPQPIAVAVNDNEKGRELLQWLLEDMAVVSDEDQWWVAG